MCLSFTCFANFCLEFYNKFCKFFSWILEHHKLCSYHAHTLLQQCFITLHNVFAPKQAPCTPISPSPFICCMFSFMHLYHEHSYLHNSSINTSICVCYHHKHTALPFATTSKTRYIIECKKLYNNFTTIVICNTCTCTPSLQLVKEQATQTKCKNKIM